MDAGIILPQPAATVHGPSPRSPGFAIAAISWDAAIIDQQLGRSTMHSAIVLIENWYSVDQNERLKFAATIAPIAGGPGVCKLDENLWQIDFRKSPTPLGLLIAACERHHLAYRVLACEKIPEWSPPLPNHHGAQPAR
jgi:hypothetical protein